MTSSYSVYLCHTFKFNNRAKLAWNNVGIVHINVIHLELNVVEECEVIKVLVLWTITVDPF
jgi:hypothetical protein